MEWWLLLLLLFSFLIGLLIIGFPVAFSFLMVNFIGIFLLQGVKGFHMLILSMVDSLLNYSLSAIPLFILMGEVFFHSQIGFRSIDAINKWLGSIPGRLSILAIIAGTLFASLSGSSMANTALLGRILAPEMVKRGYSKTMSLGPIMATGGLASIIPPSGMIVLLGSLAKISIGGLLIAGIVPGLILAFLFISYVVIKCYLDPTAAPKYETISEPFSEKIISLVKYILPLGIVISSMFGLIFLGIATPTESAAIGALSSFIIAIVYNKGLKKDVIVKSLYGTLSISVMMFMIITCSIAFSQILAFSGITRNFVDLIISLPLTPLLLIVAMQVIIIILGCFIDQISIMMISIPLFMPLVLVTGFDPIWFGILMLISLELGFTTPPFGLLLFVMKGVAPPGTTMGEIYRSIIPFIVLDVLLIALILIFPPLVTWLPELMR